MRNLLAIFIYNLGKVNPPPPIWEKVPNLSGFYWKFVKFLSHATQIKYFLSFILL